MGPARARVLVGGPEGGRGPGRRGGIELPGTGFPWGQGGTFSIRLQLELLVNGLELWKGNKSQGTYWVLMQPPAGDPGCLGSPPPWRPGAPLLTRESFQPRGREDDRTAPEIPPPKGPLGSLL